MITETGKDAGGIAQKLEQLAEMCRQGHASDMMLKTLHKLFGYEARSCLSQLEELRQALSDFEQRHGMSSDLFYRRFKAGETDDRMDFVEWASLVQMTRRLEKRLALLETDLAFTLPENSQA